MTVVLNKSAAARTIAELRLLGRNQSIAEHWLSLWHGDRLPARAMFCSASMESFEADLLLFDIVPNARVTVRHAGSRFRRLLGRDLKGADWVADAPESHRALRLQNLSAVARGAILVGRRRTTMRIGGANFNEEIVLPFAAEPCGTVPALAHAVWPFDATVTPASIFEMDPVTEKFQLYSLSREPVAGA